MGAAIIGVIGTLLGVAIGGGVNYFINRSQFIREKKYQEQQVLRQKLEEICQVIERINQSYNNVWADAWQSLKYGKQMPLDDDPLPFARLSMLINFYAPELKENFKLLEDNRNAFGMILIDVIYNAQAEESKRQKIHNDLSIARGYIAKVCTAMEDEAASLARFVLVPKQGLGTQM